MADEKPTILQPFRLRHRVEPLEFALADAPLERTAINVATPELQPLRRRKRGDPSPPKNVAMPWKKPWDR
jgi:hypothetical protein